MRSCEFAWTMAAPFLMVAFAGWELTSELQTVYAISQLTSDGSMVSDLVSLLM